jgi:hypothetical protein
VPDLHPHRPLQPSPSFLEPSRLSYEFVRAQEKQARRVVKYPACRKKFGRSSDLQVAPFLVVDLTRRVGEVEIVGARLAVAASRRVLQYLDKDLGYVSRHWRP